MVPFKVSHAYFDPRNRFVAFAKPLPSLPFSHAFFAIHPSCSICEVHLLAGVFFSLGVPNLRKPVIHLSRASHSRPGYLSSSTHSCKGRCTELRDADFRILCKRRFSMNR